MKTNQSLFDLLLTLADGMDLVDPRVADHHRRTAFIAAGLGREAGFSPTDLNELVSAALIHDVGAFSLQQRLDTLHFEFKDPERHARLGHNLLADFGPLAAEARIIRSHHAWWRPPDDRSPGGDTVPLSSHILHLADRMAILAEKDGDPDVLGAEILDRVSDHMGTMFRPDLKPLLLRLAQSRSFWVGLLQPALQDVFQDMTGTPALALDLPDLRALAGMFRRFIDYRSHFTATHSAGVAGVGEALAGYLGFSNQNRQLMQVACYLHDLGKLAIPPEIIEKPGSLTDREYHLMQDHALYTRRLLERVPALGHGITWAAQHHERMDGTGYPEHSRGDEVFFGSRVVAVADIFTAITEDRPHRRGLAKEAAMKKLGGMRFLGSLDGEVVSVARERFDDLNHVRMECQFKALKDYEECVGIN